MNDATTTTTQPASLSERLSIAAEQAQGMADALDRRLGNDIEELEALGAFLALASADAARLEAPVRIVCEVEDGLLQSVYADRPVDVIKMDFDTEGADPDEIERVPLYGVGSAHAWVDEYAATCTPNAAAYVATIHERPEPGAPDRDTDQRGNTWPATDADGES